MKYALVLLFSLFSFWLLLSGYWDNTLILTFGVLSTLLATYVGLKIKQQNEFETDLLFFIRFPVYVIWLSREIYNANLDTVRRILFPKKYPISPTVEILKMSQSTRFAHTIYANSITITPGTISIDIIGNHVLVHALVKDSIDDLKQGRMDAKVFALEAKP